MVKINRLQIKNYRQYKELDFKFHEEDGLYLFVGKNSQGKSNFMNAICWCLYGDEPFMTNNENRIIINDTLDFGDDPEKYFDVSVSMEVQIDDVKLTFNRSVLMNMFGDTNGNPKFYVFEQSTSATDSHLAEDPEVYVNRLLPKSLRRFFLFDGEDIDSLFSDDYAPKLKENILKVTDIDLLNRTLDMLRYVERPITSKATKDFPKEKSLIEEKITIEEQIVTLKKEINDLTNTITKSDSKIVELNSRLNEYKYAKDFINQRESLKIRKKVLEEEIENNQRKIRKVTSQKVVFVLLRKTLKEYSYNISRSKSEGKVPPNIRKGFLEQLIKSKKCICGNNVIEGSKEYDNLVRIINEVSDIDELDSITGDGYRATQIMEDINTIYEDMTTSKKLISDDQEELRKINNKLDDISTDLRTSPEVEIGDLEKTIYAISGERENDNRDKILKDEDLKKKNSRKEEIIAELKEIDAKKIKRSSSSIMSSFLIDSQNILEKIEENLTLEVKELVSVETDRCFKSMLYEKDKYEKVSFNDNYEVEVRKHGDTNNSFKMFGTGEKKVLGLSTVKALSIVSGFKDVPVFIDGLVEFLGPEIRNNVYSTLEEFRKDKQVFIFSLNHKDVIDFGRENIDKEYFFMIEKGSIRKFN